MIKNTIAMLKMAYRFAPQWVIFTIVQSIFTALSSVLTSVMVVKVVYNGIIGVESFDRVAVGIALISLFIISNCIINSVYYGKTYGLGLQQIKDHVSRMINTKTVKIDTSLLYDAEFKNIHSMVCETFPTKIMEVVLYMSFYFANVLAIVLCLVISATISYRLVILGCTFIPILVIISKKNKSYKRAVEINKAEFRKQKDYFSKVFSEKEYSEEIRLYPFTYRFKRRLGMITEELIEKVSPKNKKLFIFEFAEQGLLNVVIYWGLILCLSISIIKGVYPVSYLLPTVTVAFQLISRINGLSNIFSSMQDFSKYYEQYNILMHSSTDVEDQNGIMTTESIDEISINNLSFKYRGDEKSTLKNINMHIERGQIVGVVGENGAGKTTLVRILLGLYDNYTGDIYINGINLRALNMQSYRQRISHVLQNFNIFACTLYENIALGKNRIDEKKVFEVLKSSTLLKDMTDCRESDNTFNPIMTKEFDKDGVELSGGQKKKLAIARGLYKESSCIYLDEPSSALDPLSEARIVDIINHKVAEKALLVISHRLNAIKNVDWIYYMENGEIIEQGTHEMLIAMHGKYEEMYNTQTKMIEEARDD